MIVIDTSAIIAILLEEPAAVSLNTTLFQFSLRILSPVAFTEATMVLSRTTSDPKHQLDAYIRHAELELRPIDAEQAEWARHAFLTYGKGRHPARLNLGDCFSYAAAKAADAPLLYVGDDFAKTDIRTA